MDQTGKAGHRTRMKVLIANIAAAATRRQVRMAAAQAHLDRVQAHKDEYAAAHRNTRVNESRFEEWVVPMRKLVATEPVGQVFTDAEMLEDATESLRNLEAASFEARRSDGQVSSANSAGQAKEVLQARRETLLKLTGESPDGSKASKKSVWDWS